MSDNEILVPLDYTATEAIARVIHFTFRPAGWVTFMICERTCELSVQSDWGSWAYRWNSEGLGYPTLVQALVGFDVDYVARKLEPNQKEICPALAEQNLRLAVLQCRRERQIGAQRARYLWTMIDDFCEQLEDAGPVLAIERAGYELQEFCNGEIYEYFVHRDRHEFLLLRDGLLPALRIHLIASGVPRLFVPWSDAERHASDARREARLKRQEHGDEYELGEWVPPTKRATGCTCQMCWYRYPRSQMCCGVTRGAR